MVETILVTGATGKIGGHLIAALAKEGRTVRAAVRLKTHFGRVAKSGVTPVELDFTRPESVAPAFAGVDKAFLLVPFEPTLAEMGLMLVKAAQNAGLKQIVYMSASGADAEPGSTVGRWHRTVEKAVIASGIPYTILRPTFFMQNFTTGSAATIKSQGAFYQPSGDGRVAYIDVRDIAACAAVVLTQPGHDGKEYVLTGGKAICNHEAAAILSIAVGKQISYVDVSEDMARASLMSAGLPEWMVGVLLELMAIQKKGYASAVSPAVQQLIGRAPISCEQFAKNSAFALR